jgi:hypothetical protein
MGIDVRDTLILCSSWLQSAESGLNLTVPRAGMRIPLNGEAGWYIDGMLQIVWKGDLIDAQFKFGP